MDIFENGKEPSTSVAAASRALARAAGRLVLSMVRSIKYMEPAAVEHFRNLFSAHTLWVLAIILAGWVIATIVGGPIALVINGLLGAYGLYQLYEQLALTWENLRKWALTAYHAKNEGDIDAAARFFANAVADGILALLEVIVTHRIFKSVEGGLRNRYPTPEWLEAEYARAVREAEQKRPGAPNRRSEPARSMEEAERTAEKQRREEAERAAERKRRASEGKSPTPPPPIPTGGSPWVAVALGALGVVGTGAAIAWALNDSEGRKRS